MNPLSLHFAPITSADEVVSLQNLFESAPRYFQNVFGEFAPPTAGKEALEALPPNCGYEDKFLFRVYLGKEMIGCIDLVRGYPDRKTAMLGLLLISEKHQGAGLGGALFRKVEQIVQKWSGMETIRISVLESNSEVFGFWKKMGFIDSGIRRPYHQGKVKTQTQVWEKKVHQKKSRYSMSVKLSKMELPDTDTTIRKVTPEDAIDVGNLMLAAYRNSIDDEGETQEQYKLEVLATLRGKWGPVVDEASFVVIKENHVIAATIITIWEDKPLLAYSITHPKEQRRGLATFLIKKSMNALFESGFQELVLGVTAGNTTAESLYRKLGFTKFMRSMIPSDHSHTLKTDRLVLEPITRLHAQELVNLFSDPELHRYTPSEAPTLEQQLDRCQRWEKRISPDESEIWLNWAARLNQSGTIIGHFQAGIKADQIASIGYVVSGEFQNQGIGTEALQSVFNFLRDQMQVVEIKAWSDTRNVASHRLAQKMGMTQVDLIKNADSFKGGNSDEFVFSKVLKLPC